MDIITSVTILLVVGAILWFGNKFLTTAKAREATLAKSITDAVNERVTAIEADIAHAHTKIEEAKAELKQDVIGLFENQKSLTNALSLNAKTSGGSIGAVLEAYNKSRQAR